MTHEPLLDMLVVGGGMAGLGAAYEATERGMRHVTVLEASDTVGGRVRTKNGVEHGAQFLHDTTLLPLLERYGLTGVRHDEEQRPYTYFHDDRDQYGRLERDKEGKFSITALLQEIRAHIATLTRYREWSVSRLLDTELMHLHSSLAKRLSDKVGDIFRTVLTAELGASLDLVSVHTALHERNTYDDSNYIVQEGYGELPERIAQDLRARGVRIQTRSPVSSIDWHGDGFDAEANGKTYSARRAVVTAPLGVLKNGAVRFVRPLPSTLTQAIDHLGNGQVCKFIYTFKKPFWDENMTILRTNIPESPMLWPNRSAAQPSLTCFVGGPAARQLQLLTPREAIAQGIHHLRTIFHDRLQSIEFASEPVFVPWNRLRNFQSGYLVRMSGDHGASNTFEEPVDGVFAFAGEAFSNTERAGTVSGAWEDGRKKAALVATV